jgi:hypothetical protein
MPFEPAPAGLAGPDRDPHPVDPYAAVGWLFEALNEVLDLGLHRGVPHDLGRLLTVHHHGPLEVRHGAGYRVYAVKVSHRYRPSVLSRRVALT